MALSICGFAGGYSRAVFLRPGVALRYTPGCVLAPFQGAGGDAQYLIDIVDLFCHVRITGLARAFVTFFALDTLAYFIAQAATFRMIAILITRVLLAALAVGFVPNAPDALRNHEIEPVECAPRLALHLGFARLEPLVMRRMAKIKIYPNDTG